MSSNLVRTNNCPQNLEPKEFESTYLLGANVESPSMQAYLLSIA